MKIQFRFPDDPMRISSDYLKRLSDEKKPGTWIAQPKYDGWRRPAYKIDGKWTFFAKRGTGEESKRTPPPDISRALDALDLPDGTAFDAEWMGPRDINGLLKGRHYLVLFDLQYQAGEWLGAVPFEERLKRMRKMLHDAKYYVGDASFINVAPTVDSDWFKYYTEMTKDPLVEGIVLKEASGGLVGDYAKAKDNGSWYKVKYRDIHENTKF